MSHALIEDLERDGFGHWFAGFVDGEGCFSLQRVPQGQVAPRFVVTLRDDDRPILEAIAARTGIGTLRPLPARLTFNPQATWAVASKRDHMTLVSIFDRFPLRAKKAQDYEIWRRAVLIHSRHRPGESWDQL